MDGSCAGTDHAFGIPCRHIDNEVAVGAATPAVVDPVALAEINNVGRVRTDKPKAFVRNGGGATLGIRPERLRVLWDNATAKFEVAGKVVERHYFGEITHLIVEIPGLEKPLSVTETNDFGADDIPVGTSIRLAYDPEALVAMAD